MSEINWYFQGEGGDHGEVGDVGTWGTFYKPLCCLPGFVAPCCPLMKLPEEFRKLLAGKVIKDAGDVL